MGTRLIFPSISTNMFFWKMRKCTSNIYVRIIRLSAYYTLSYHKDHAEKLFAIQAWNTFL